METCLRGAAQKTLIHPEGELIVTPLGTFRSGRLDILCLASVLLMTSFSYPMSGLSAEPEPGDPAILTIDRIFGSKDFEVKRYSARWIEGRNAFTTLIDSPNDHQRKVLQRIDAATGEEEVILTPQDLIPSGAESPLTIDGYTLSEDKSTVLVY